MRPESPGSLEMLKKREDGGNLASSEGYVTAESRPIRFFIQPHGLDSDMLRSSPKGFSTIFFAFLASMR
jgi:hypothetical protein